MRLARLREFRLGHSVLIKSDNKYLVRTIVLDLYLAELEIISQVLSNEALEVTVYPRLLYSVSNPSNLP